MADILQVARRYFSGLAADLPASANVGDVYFATDTGHTYKWDGAAWAAKLGTELINRPCLAADFDQGDLTLDGTWKVDGLDLSAIVPAGANAAVVYCSVQDNAAGELFMIRQNATNTFNRAEYYTQVANIYIPSTPVLIALDSNRLWDYNGDVGIAVINIYIVGWFI